MKTMARQMVQHYYQDIIHQDTDQQSQHKHWDIVSDNIVTFIDSGNWHSEGTDELVSISTFYMQVN